MNKLIKNHYFNFFIVCILSFMDSGKTDDLWDGIQHGFDAVMMEKGL